MIFSKGVICYHVVKITNGWLFEPRVNPVSCLKFFSQRSLDINEINDLGMKTRLS